METDLRALEARARAVRARVVLMAHAGRTPHVGSALSCVELLVGAYFHALRGAPGTGEGDVFLLSKGHGCMAQYATLVECGIWPEALLQEYARDGGRLAEHPSPISVPGIVAATGSLGHGLSIGAGLALAAKMRGLDRRVFVLLSDGECYEGSVWEAAIFARTQRLDNLVAMVDYNGWSAMGRTTAAMAPLLAKWQAFGWAGVEIDGHDLGAVALALASAPVEAGRPTVIVARTVKGKGVSFMENDLEWHYRPPSDEDLRRALAEIGR